MNETFAIDEPKEKEEKRKNPTQYYVKFSFVITYILLLTTGTITFIEAMRTQIPSVRHVMNLETCISVVAGYFYSVFVEKIEDMCKTGKPIDWANITVMRYIDWSITTPMMLIVLSLFLGSHVNVPIHFSILVFIMTMNYLMLYIGYLGEIGTINHKIAMISGFVPFILMFGTIFVKFVQPKYKFANYVLFTIFTIIWSMYGIVYILDEQNKNIAMNILDSISKCFVGLSLWVYYAKIITV
jgi:bacteriorhodopsin